MKRQRHSPEQIIRKLRVAEQMLSEGKTAGEAAKALEVSEQTLHRWRNQYGGMKAEDVKRLKELERENGQLKRLVADKELENLALKEIAKGRSQVSRSATRRRPFAASAAVPSRSTGQQLDLAQLLLGDQLDRVAVILAAGKRVPEHNHHLAGGGDDRDPMPTAATSALIESAQRPGVRIAE